MTTSGLAGVVGAVNDLAADAELYVFDGCIAAQRWQDGDPIDLGIIVSFPDDPVGLLHEIATAAGWTQRSDAYYGTAYRRPDAGVVAAEDQATS